MTLTRYQINASSPTKGKYNLYHRYLRFKPTIRPVFRQTKNKPFSAGTYYLSLYFVFNHLVAAIRCMSGFTM